MREVTIQINDKDAKYLEKHEKQINWFFRVKASKTIEDRIISKVAKVCATYDDFQESI